MIIDPSGRGPTMRQLLLAGVAMFLVVGLLITLLMLRYMGVFDKKMPVTAMLTSVGDGLPFHADVKYRGVFVGTVSKVEVARQGEEQRVSIDMQPDRAKDIPNSVTARVVPANVFAVTAVELIDNGKSGRSLQEGDVIPQDKSKATVALQDTMTTLRNVLNKIDPKRLGTVLGAISEALDSKNRPIPGSTIERLDRVLTGLNESADLGTFLTDLAAASNAINQSQPELLDALGTAVNSARTISEKRVQLAAMLTGSRELVESTNALFARNPNSGKDVTSGLATTFGALTSKPDAIPNTISNIDKTVTELIKALRGGPSQQLVWEATITFTPFKMNTRADCPRYGELAGPSCTTAPVTRPSFELPEQLKPQPLGPDGKPAPQPTSGTAPKPQAPGTDKPQIPGLPHIPGLPPIPGVTPAGNQQHPGLRGDAAVAKVAGGQPTMTQIILLGAALSGGEIREENL